MSDNPPEDPKPDWEGIVGKIIKGLGVLFAVAGLILILVVGLALGACFLGGR
jgi:hypothetical protein